VGFELRGSAKVIDSAQPANHWVPTVENLGHRIVPGGRYLAPARSELQHSNRIFVSGEELLEFLPQRLAWGQC
jgi:hypothetical protein